MKRKTIVLSLTTKGSLQKAIDKIEEYSQTIQNMSEMFVMELANVGITALSVRINSISPFYKGSDLSVSLQMLNGSLGASIVMSGKQCAFIEFGSGVLFNAPKGSSLHPKGEELGLTIGSYNPNSPNAESPTGWFYYDEYGQKQHTYGTPTFAPMHNSEMEMLSQIKEIAERVFSQ